MSSVQSIQTLASTYKSLQEKLKLHQTCRQQLLIQDNESSSVLKELKQIEEDALLYRLIGPVMVPQTKEEGVSVVTKRLSYIHSELSRVDKLTEETLTDLKNCTKQIEALQKSQSGVTGH